MLAMTSSWYFPRHVDEGNYNFLVFKFHSLICLPFINFTYTTNYSTSAFKKLPRELQSISHPVTHADWLLLISSFLQVTSLILKAQSIFKIPCPKSFFAMNPLLFLDCSSTDSCVFYVDCWSTEKSPAQINNLAVRNSTQLSGAMARETITISSVASLEPQIVIIHSDSNEPTIAYVFGDQLPILPVRLNDLSLQPNPFSLFGYYGRN